MRSPLGGPFTYPRISFSTWNYGTSPAYDLDDRSFRRLAQVTCYSKTLSIVQSLETRLNHAKKSTEL